MKEELRPLPCIKVLLCACTCIPAGGGGNWKRDGCSMSNRDVSVVICECNRLGTFGVLVVSSKQDHILAMISVLGNLGSVTIGYV